MTDTTDLWYGTSGPHDADIVLVGEAWGAEEAQAHQPFVGSSGTELRRMLAEAHIDADKVLMTNVVAARPLNNEMWRFFHAKASDAAAGSSVRGLNPDGLVLQGLDRLYRQIQSSPRRLVIAVGNYALWALSDVTGVDTIRESNRRKLAPDEFRLVPTGIGNWRGSMHYMLPRDTPPQSTEFRETTRIPLLPIIHPAAIMRDWSQRAVTVHDLKARVPMALAGDWRPAREPLFWAPPTFLQARLRLELWLARADSGHTVTLVEDIETARGHITVIGLSDAPSFAMAIPFVVPLDTGGLASYWSLDQEVTLWRLLCRVNSHPNIHIRNQNFIYDTQYIAFWHGITPHMDADTMLLQNLLFPGTPKDLNHLSSLYCTYHWYWKDDGKEWNTKDGRLEDLLVYNCIDTTRTFEICERQLLMVEQLKMQPQWAIKKYQYDLCLRMMRRGVRFDTRRRGELLMQLDEALGDIEARLDYICPQALVNSNSKVARWFNSNHQIKTLLHDMLGLPKVMHRKTGEPTSGKEALQDLKRKFPHLGLLFDLLDEYGSGANTRGVIQMKLDDEGDHWRARCSYNPAGTETHRLSSSKNVFGGGTNLQNLTVGEEE